MKIGERENGTSGQGDDALLDRLRVGENDAATALYLRYAQKIQRLAKFQTSETLSHKVNAEEIVQTVFRTFFRRASHGSYSVAEGGDLWNLLLVIALNKIRKYSDYHRAQKRDLRRTRVLAPEYFECRADSSTDEDVSFTLLKLTIRQLVESLSESHQQIIQLRIEGNTVPEIAKTTGRAKRTVERTLQDFRKRLLNEVEDQAND